MTQWCPENCTSGQCRSDSGNTLHIHIVILLGQFPEQSSHTVYGRVPGGDHGHGFPRPRFLQRLTDTQELLPHPADFVFFVRKHRSYLIHIGLIPDDEIGSQQRRLGLWRHLLRFSGADSHGVYNAAGIAAFL